MTPQDKRDLVVMVPPAILAVIVIWLLVVLSLTGYGS